MFILGEGWKEFKVGTISEVEEEVVLNPVTLEEEPQARAKQTSYVAALGGPEAIGEYLARGRAARLAEGLRNRGGGRCGRLDLEPGRGFLL